MDRTTAIQNLHFFSKQAKKYRRNINISDEDLLQFSKELEEFKKDVKHSNLPSDLKKDIKSLDLTYTDTKTSAGSLMMTIGAVTLGVAVGIFFLSRRSRRKAHLELLRTKTEMLAEKIAAADRLS